jgi:hypothetical protein
MNESANFYQGQVPNLPLDILWGKRGTASLSQQDIANNDPFLASLTQDIALSTNCRQPSQQWHFHLTFNITSCLSNLLKAVEPGGPSNLSWYCFAISSETFSAYALSALSKQSISPELIFRGLEDGGQGRNRTADAGLFRAALYRLSYLAD